MLQKAHSSAPMRSPLQSGHFGLLGKRDTMEDVVLTLDEVKLPGQITSSSPVSSSSSFSLYAVFDGHGGTAASQFAASNLPSFFTSHIARGSSIQSSLRAAFLEVDKAFEAHILAQKHHQQKQDRSTTSSSRSNEGAGRVSLSRGSGGNRTMNTINNNNNNHNHNKKTTASSSSSTNKAFQVTGLDILEDAEEGFRSAEDAATKSTRKTTGSRSSSSSILITNDGNGAANDDDDDTSSLVEEQSGTTAVVAVITGGRFHSDTLPSTSTISPLMLTVASVGDSRAVLCRRATAIPMTKDHTTSRVDERDRILAAGGVILRGRVLGRLAVTRAIGDISLKRGVNNKPLVTADPEISEMKLEEDDILLLGCDGVFDVLSNQQACDVVRGALSTGRHVSDAARSLAETAYDEGSADNISAVVVRLSSGGSGSGGSSRSGNSSIIKPITTAGSSSYNNDYNHHNNSGNKSIGTENYKQQNQQQQVVGGPTISNRNTNVGIGNHQTTNTITASTTTTGTSLFPWEKNSANNSSNNGSHNAQTGQNVRPQSSHSSMTSATTTTTTIPNNVFPIPSDRSRLGAIKDNHSSGGGFGLGFGLGIPSQQQQQQQQRTQQPSERAYNAPEGIAGVPRGRLRGVTDYSVNTNNTNSNAIINNNINNARISGNNRRDVSPMVSSSSAAAVNDEVDSVSMLIAGLRTEVPTGAGQYGNYNPNNNRGRVPVVVGGGVGYPNNNNNLPREQQQQQQQIQQQQQQHRAPSPMARNTGAIPDAVGAGRRYNPGATSVGALLQHQWSNDNNDNNNNNNNNNRTTTEGLGYLQNNGGARGRRR